MSQVEFVAMAACIPSKKLQISYKIIIDMSSYAQVKLLVNRGSLASEQTTEQVQRSEGDKRGKDP